MQFDLDIGGRVRRIRVTARDDARLEVSVDERMVQVDAQAVGHDRLSLLVGDGEGRVRSVEAAVAPQAGGAGFEVAIDGHTWLAALVTPHGRPTAAGAAGGSGPQELTAPMPGKIMRVLVAPGDAVEARQGLVVIEAMKMENELRASRSGRVTLVRVAEGQSVEAGAPLVTVE
ncbi:MAG: acetyl-CoA carboxylase biotin carboxyl carrier protein subunit [Acidobacteriota bacterium]|nr:acetyl-CoA carboxylase biotin carboxyl carrier protein subunit [Acidobacteriota bacterium]